MLVLARRRNQAVIITTPSGERIRVLLVESGWGRVRLGFEAGPDVEIFREELQRDIDAGKASVSP